MRHDESGSSPAESKKGRSLQVSGRIEFDVLNYRPARAPGPKPAWYNPSSVRHVTAFHNCASSLGAPGRTSPV